MFVSFSASWCEFSQRTWIDRATDDSAERVPGTVIEPVVKLVKALLSQETSGAVIEIPEGVSGAKRDTSNHARLNISLSQLMSSTFGFRYLRIKLVDDTLKSQHGEKASGKRCKARE